MINSGLPEERLSATFNTLPSESSDLLPHTGSVSPCLSTTEGNSTRPSSTENGHISGTLFTSPSTSGEPSITIDSPVPAGGPPQNLISNTSTVTPGSTLSRKNSGKLTRLHLCDVLYRSYKFTLITCRI